MLSHSSAADRAKINRLPVFAALIILLAPPACTHSDPHQARLPDARIAAAQTGQPVEFQDTIQAISRSRSKPGYYLSFGAPYPDQLLSVWVPDDVYTRISRPGVDRVVRIKGRVDASPTGPLLALESPDQYALLPVDRAILDTRKIDGRIDKEHFAAALGQTIDEGDFETLERLGEELERSGERCADGAWMLSLFFGELHLSAHAPESAYVRTGATLASWAKHYPWSTPALVANADHHVALAWKYRGDGYADTVSEAGWENFRRELDLARQALESAPGAKSSPHYFYVMQQIALGQGWPREDYMRLFNEAVTRTPDYPPHYFSAAIYLLPRWHGEPGDWETFAETQRLKIGGDTGDALYARIAWSMHEMVFRDLFNESAISWDTMAAGFQALIRRYPGSRSLKNVYANFAWKARDRARLGPALEAVKDDPDFAVWVNLENVRLAEAFARGDPAPEKL